MKKTTINRGFGRGVDRTGSQRLMPPPGEIVGKDGLRRFTERGIARKGSVTASPSKRKK